MVARVMVANLSKQEIAQQRIELFQEAYGEQALDVACHLAFPLTMTTDLSYCLRQQFFPEMHWSIAATVVLSGLYEEVGYDLYEMAVATRSLLLARLVKNFGNVRLFEISDFMQGYILYRLTQNAGDRPQLLGDPAEWIALACLTKGEGKFREMIRRELQDLLAKSPDINERFRLAALIHQQGDLLAQRGFEAFSIQELAGRIAKGEPIDPLSDIRQFMEANGFPELKSEEIEYATIVFDAVNTEEELHSFEFETVTIDGTGKEVDRQNHTAYSFTESLADGVGLEMVAIPSGKFMMGSPLDQKNSFDDERPQHEVTVQPFFMGQTPVTQAQWRVVAGFPQVKRTIELNPSNFKGDDLPVEQVFWEDAEEFCLRLSVHARREWEYRLPTEAEWEYACRAGTKTPFHFGETIAGKFANYDASVVYQSEKKDKKSEGTTPVKKYLPNSFGLYDCHGNICEWCLDDWHDDYKGASIDGKPWFDQNANKDTSKVLRGGSWFCTPLDCRSASRAYNPRASRISWIGFRVLCSASSGNGISR